MPMKRRRGEGEDPLPVWMLREDPANAARAPKQQGPLGTLCARPPPRKSRGMLQWPRVPCL